MLAKIREKTHGIIATLILGFVAIPFVLWGIGSYFGHDTTLSVAKVNGVEISQQAYRQRLEEMQGANPQRADNRVIKEFVIESLIDQTLLESQARDSGYRVGDDQLAQMIHDIPYFQRDGQFQPGLYEALLRQQGLRPSDFEARMRQDNIVAQVQRGLSESAFATEAEISAIMRLLQQQRRVSYALVRADAFLPKATVSAQEIDDYYRANQESFRSPEAVRVEYLTLKAADIAQQVQLTEAELRQAYEADAARYVTPEQRRISHLLISLPSQAKDDAVAAAKKRADDLLKQIRAGADFAAVAKNNSSDTESARKGGDLGELKHGVLPTGLEAAAVALKPGEVSEPVRTSFGFHLVKLTALTPEQRKPYESVKQELTDVVRKRKGEERFYELSERFRNLVYEHPEGLAIAAKELGLKVQTSDWFTRAGGPGIAAQPRVVTAAFESEVLSRERNSDAVEVNAETLVALHVTDHRPSAVRPLAEVRAAIESALKERRAREQAQAAAQQWVKEIDQGKTLQDLARAPGVTLQAEKTLTRVRPPQGIDPRIVDAVFAAPRPKDRPVVGQVDLGKEGYAVYALEAVTDGDPAAADAALKPSVRQQLLQRRGADYYISYRAGLRKSADVKINAEQL